MSDSGCSSGLLSLLFLDTHLYKMISGGDLLLSIHIFADIVLPLW